MSDLSAPVQRLLSLPPGAVRAFDALRRPDGPEWFIAADPPGGKLGSGGGTAYMLAEAWKATGEGASFGEWLRRSRKLIVHGGGQSRRLPAYAPLGKPLIPVPALRRSCGQRLDQTLLDLQEPACRRLLARAPEGSVAMVVSGDTLLHFGRELPAFPESDVLAVGMPVAPETAQHFGVFFLPRSRSDRLAFFLQKPSPERIRALAEEHAFLVDTGVWLLSERAVEALFARCGWDAERECFAHGAPDAYELYAQFGLGLGEKPARTDALINTLSCAVIALPEPEFYHLGTSRQLIESVTALQNRPLQHPAMASARAHPDQIVQNAVFDPPIRREANPTLWIENATVPAGWRLERDHVLTGVPDNDWNLELEPGVCLDFVPIGESDWCIRAYGMDDPFSGPVGDDATLWWGRPAPQWFAARGIGWEEAGLDPACDIQQAGIFPVLPPDRLEPRFIEWLFASDSRLTTHDSRLTALWLSLPRLSAEEIAREANLPRLAEQRARNRLRALLRL
jgi:hypothetical protein